jgi:hypothetical protein
VADGLDLKYKWDAKNLKDAKDHEKANCSGGDSYNHAAPDGSSRSTSRFEPYGALISIADLMDK